ncbi:cyclase family protein [Amycolatopsis jejuensis]|uniref:cyclase family protein n=1 Tax=Amycolatopsis jejuensis TaxID=330084 RepID=UPI0005275976|nr:cyclase family protein [Amycolatopsis jejuensis]
MQLPSEDDVRRLLERDRNWTRWGPDDQRGAINLIDDAKRRQAAALVRSGRSVSLSRPLDASKSPHNPTPIGQELVRTTWRSADAGYAHDAITIDCHSRNITHLDALCHIWDRDGMWGGRQPDEVLSESGSSWGDIDNWSDGIVTRGLLLDIPGLRGTECVEVEEPVHGNELAAAVAAAGLTVEPGDALCVFGGRDEWDARHHHEWTGYPPDPRPGLHASCLEFLRDHDVAMLVWDNADVTPSGYEVPWTVHGALMSYGVALLDQAQLGPLTRECRAAGRYEFMLCVAPLRIPGGTGSPVNPIAIL